MKILGIDPGYDRLGIAVVSGNASQPVHEHSECFTPESKDFYERLVTCGKRFAAIVDEHKPDAVALETLFVTNNQKTAMRVAELRGALLYEATRHNVPIYEYTPSQVKLAVAGHGASDKRAVADMTKRLIKLPERTMIDDEMDAIAVALTHLAQAR